MALQPTRYGVPPLAAELYIKGPHPRKLNGWSGSQPGPQPTGSSRPGAVLQRRPSIFRLADAQQDTLWRETSQRQLIR